MTNFEYYSKHYPEIMIELLSNNKNHNMLAYDTAENIPVACYNMTSYRCQTCCKFYNGTIGDSDSCKERIKHWLESPYEGTDNTSDEMHDSQGGITW